MRNSLSVETSAHSVLLLCYLPDYFKHKEFLLMTSIKIAIILTSKKTKDGLRLAWSKLSIDTGNILQRNLEKYLLDKKLNQIFFYRSNCLG